MRRAPVGGLSRRRRACSHVPDAPRPRPVMTADSRLHDRLLGDPALMERFGGRAQLQAMLDAEAALAAADAAAPVHMFPTPRVPGRS